MNFFILQMFVLRALSDGEWEQLYGILHTCPSLVLQSFSFHFCELSILHVASWQWGDLRWFQLIQYVIRIAPSTVTKVDDAGSLPLHYCLRSRYPSKTIVEPLLDANPRTAIGDKTGRTALHIACENPYTPIAVIHTFIDTNPSAVSMCDEKGRLPLHIVCRNKSLSEHVVPILLKLDSSAVWVQDFDGQIPLHMACPGRTWSEPCIQELPQADPKTVSMRDDNGQTARHHCILLF